MENKGCFIAVLVALNIFWFIATPLFFLPGLGGIVSVVVVAAISVLVLAWWAYYYND